MKKLPNIGVLGGSFMQAEFVYTAIKLGYPVYIFDGNAQCMFANKSDGNFVHLNFSDEKKLYNFCLENEIKYLFCPSNELGNLIISRLAPKLGFSYNSNEVVLNTIDKGLQRKKSACLTNIYSPKNLIFNNSIENVLDKLSFPMVVKPSNSSASRGVTGVNSQDELKDALEEANKHLTRESQIIIEEFIGGTQLSVETISVNGEHYIAGVTKEIVSPSPFFIERSHFMDPEVHNLFMPKIEKAIKALLDSNQIFWGPCHIELKIDGDKVVLIEIASRSGGLRDRLMLNAGYPDYNKLIIDACIKERINLEDIQPPNKYSLVNILTQVDDLYPFVNGKKDKTLESFYFYSKGPVLDPKSLIDAYAYAFFTNSKSLKKYSLK
jgi:phosphoribosylaminoimidazole carboxylase (NCAIR synthetase)